MHSNPTKRGRQVAERNNLKCAHDLISYMKTPSVGETGAPVNGVALSASDEQAIRDCADCLKTRPGAFALPQDRSDAD